MVEQFDDMRASVNYVGSFARVFADPRMVSYHAGGHVHPNVSITGSRPLTMADSGKSILVISDTDVTLTIGDDVTEGFKATLIQAAAGKIKGKGKSSHMIYSNARGRTRTLSPLDEAGSQHLPIRPGVPGLPCQTYCITICRAGFLLHSTPASYSHPSHRQTWSTIPASGIEELGHGQDQRGIATAETRQGEGVARADRR
ncbi:hypothetical protein QMK56_17545 [Pseudomonas protegens]|nr:hypothetical protein [Pseudomonas protegens]